MFSTGVTGTKALTRAVLPLCLLGVLGTGEREYGYALLSRLDEAGLSGVKEEGAVEIEWGAGEGGPGRKYYRITEEGRERLRREGEAWRELTGVVGALLKGGGA
ncbi:PadR family transcriptional regulator [Streptomyces niveiscabiei]|uniref:PadR family transcriptional regulator n=1 Tax=Streptomyces niveiscabiei TaxID=164115 RepID=UPI0038F64F38